MPLELAHNHHYLNATGLSPLDSRSSGQSLEDISTQNGPPKENNKIIFINFGGRKEKNYFLFIFSTYLPMFLLKFQLGELVWCGIKFSIQWLSTLHTFDGPHYPKKNYLKKCDDDIIIMFFQVFLIFGVAGSIKRMKNGYSSDAEFNPASRELSRSKFE